MVSEQDESGAVLLWFWADLSHPARDWIKAELEGVPPAQIGRHGLTAELSQVKASPAGTTLSLGDPLPVLLLPPACVREGAVLGFNIGAACCLTYSCQLLWARSCESETWASSTFDRLEILRYNVLLLLLIVQLDSICSATIQSCVAECLVVLQVLKPSTTC